MRTIFRDLNRQIPKEAYIKHIYKLIKDNESYTPQVNLLRNVLKSSKEVSQLPEEKVLSMIEKQLMSENSYELFKSFIDNDKTIFLQDFITIKAENNCEYLVTIEESLDRDITIKIDDSFKIVSMNLL